MWGFRLLLFCGCTGMGMTRLPTLRQNVKGVNECEDTTTCPAYARCTDTADGYYCTCKQGFLSSNGQEKFTGPGVVCKDINECVESHPCGPNSVCKNIPGRAKCSCLSGFSSPTGNNWIVNNSSQFLCTDIDECLAGVVCPEHSHCSNSVGSYKCICEAGFVSSGSICEDEDECENLSACPEYATCHNIVGSYYCMCNSGLESSGGGPVFQGLEQSCEDVDECSMNSSLCGPTFICINTLGSYNCSCPSGFTLSFSLIHGHPVEGTCTDVNECDDICPSNSTCSNTPGSYFCSCHSGFAPSNGQANFTDPEVSCGDIDECSQDPSLCGRNSVCTNVPGSYICSCSWASNPTQKAPRHMEISAAKVSFCALVNSTFSILDKTCENKTSAVSLKSTAERFSLVLENTPTWTNLTQEETSTLGTVLLESVESVTLAALLKPSGNASQTIQTQYLDIESKVIREECNRENVSFNLKAKGDEMKVGCSVIEESESAGTTGVAFVSFAHMESVLNERFFEEDKTSWTKSKRKLKMNSRVVGGIMTGERKEDFSSPVVYTLEHIEMAFSLSVISHVGMVISLVCLAMAIVTFLLCRTVQNHNTYMHLHLCVSLFLAKILFLIGIDKTDNQTACAIIAGFLHYLFLACFFWMLVEAVMLFLMVRNLKVVNYFSSRNVKMLHLCAFGYGLPGLVVMISASTQPRGYGMHNRCWLNTETGFIWSFLGPVCFIILINSVLLTWTLWILRQKLCSVNAEVSKLKDTRLLTFKAIAQIFILGCSWVLGIFQIGPMASIMAYLFTILNSLQGAFIFLIHCLLNRQVREEYRKFFTRKSEPSSQSQTSGILLSSMPSNSKTVSEDSCSAEASRPGQLAPQRRARLPFDSCEHRPTL